MIIILLRTFILYLAVLFAIRIMGKGELSKMDPFQMVVLFMIAELAALPMSSPSISLFHGLSALFALMFLEVFISWICTKSERLDKFFSGGPSVLINKGVIDTRELSSLRISISDLTEQLRLKNISSISDLDYAILERNGDLSVIPKQEKKPLTREDLSRQNPAGQRLPKILISDGTLYHKNLEEYHQTEEHFKKELAAFEIKEYQQVFLCFYDEASKIHVYPRSADGLVTERKRTR